MSTSPNARLDATGVNPYDRWRAGRRSFMCFSLFLKIRSATWTAPCASSLKIRVPSAGARQRGDAEIRVVRYL